MVDWPTVTDTGVVRLITVWLSGILAGEILVIAAIGTVREFKSAITWSDWAVAYSLAALSVVILAVVVRDELRS